MTLVILALDALDAALVDDFGCEEFHLNAHGEIESFALMHETPFTLEVWPGVATGLGPEEHGITGAGTSTWDNPLVDFASRFTGRLSENTRKRLGDVAHKITGAEWTFATTDKPTLFDGEDRVVHNWPGVHNSQALQEIWRLMIDTSEGRYSREEFNREVLGTCAAQFGWAREMLHHDVALAAVHVHAPDAMGHPYATERDELKRGYERIAEYVRELHEALDDDELLVLSDHGMQVEWLDDENPGNHSWRAFAATTYDTLPGHLLDVKAWVEERVQAVDVERSEIEMPTETLRDLGYLE